MSTALQDKTVSRRPAAVCATPGTLATSVNSALTPATRDAVIYTYFIDSRAASCEQTLNSRSMFVDVSASAVCTHNCRYSWSNDNWALKTASQ